MRSHQWFSVSSLIALLLVSGIAAQSNTIINGTFEDGLTGWDSGSNVPPLVLYGGTANERNEHLQINAFTNPAAGTTNITAWAEQIVPIDTLDLFLTGQMETSHTRLGNIAVPFIGMKLIYRDATQNELSVSENTELPPSGILLRTDCQAATPELVSEVVVRFEATVWSDFSNNAITNASLLADNILLIPESALGMQGMQLSQSEAAMPLRAEVAPHLTAH